MPTCCSQQGVPPTEKDDRFHLGVQGKPYGLIDAPRVEHTRLRRALASIFTTTALLNQEPLVQARVDELVLGFAQEIDEHGFDGVVEIDMTKWTKYFAFDVLGGLVLGEPFGCLSSRGVRNIHCAEGVSKTITMGAYEQVATRILGPGWLTLIPRFILVLLLAPSRFYWGRLGALLQIIRAVKARLAQEDRDDHKDIVYHVRKRNDNKNLIDKGEIQRNVRDFILAGGETVSAALTSFSYCISVSENVTVANHLRDLIRATFASKEDITWQRLREMPYMDAVVRESLRMILTSVQRLRVVPPGGMIIDGEVIPGGTTVAVSEYAANHLVSNFKDPYTFWPERWLDPDTKDSLGASKPFSYGPRDCVGKSLADMEMKLFIANLLWHYDISALPYEECDGRKGANWKWVKKNDWEHINVVAGAEAPPLFVSVRKRPGI